MFRNKLDSEKFNKDDIGFSSYEAKENKERDEKKLFKEIKQEESGRISSVLSTSMNEDKTDKNSICMTPRSTLNDFINVFNLKDDQKNESNSEIDCLDNSFGDQKQKSKFSCIYNQKAKSGLSNDVFLLVRKYGRAASNKNITNYERNTLKTNMKNMMKHKTHNLFKNKVVFPSKHAESSLNFNFNSFNEKFKTCDNGEGELNINLRSKSCPLNSFTENFSNSKYHHLISLIEENFSNDKKHHSSPFVTEFLEITEADNDNITSEEDKLIQRNEKLDKELNECYDKYFLDITHNEQGHNSKYIQNSLKIINQLLDNIFIKGETFNHKINNKKVSLPNYKINRDKKTLILDLDETLMHCDFAHKYKEHDRFVNAIFDGDQCRMPIFLRPFLTKFLEFASKNFEVVIYTASDKDYADYIIDEIDPKGKYVSFRLYRPSILNIADNIYTKPLDILENRKLENIILIDNSIYNFILNKENGYLIPSFYDNKYDCELIKLESYLKKEILNCDDVRKVNKDHYKLLSS